MSLKHQLLAAGLLGGLIAPVAVSAALAAPEAGSAAGSAAGSVAGSVVGSGASAQDAAFLVAVHQANLAEIAGGHLAEQKGADARVRALGARFVADHTAIDAALTKVAANLDVTLPSGPNATQRALAKKYEAVSGAAFDGLYLPTQLKAHAQAMAAGKEELAAGHDPQVKKLVMDAAPIVMAHHAALLDAEHALGIGGTGAYGAGPRHP